MLSNIPLGNINLRYITVLLLVLSMFGSAVTPISAADILPRRVFLGIRMENMSPERKLELQLKDNKGVWISGILPLSTALDAGFKENDILIGLQGKPVRSTKDVIVILADSKVGAQFTYELVRSGKPFTSTAVYKPYPDEKYEDLDVEYTQSTSSVGTHRMIITKSRSKEKMPVIAFVGGIGCYSLDMPFDSSASEIQLLTTLTRAGYLCARLEKPGIGDNAKYSKPCNEIGFIEEADSYVEAIKVLKKRPDVDSSSVYVIGHSMGGVFAPLINRSTSLKGIIAYGTIGSTFIDHLLRTRRTSAAAYDMNPVETDNFIRDFAECCSYYFVDGLTTEQAAQKKPICGEYLDVFELRSSKYNRELYSLGIPELWSEFAGKALLLIGESDFVSSIEDHRIIEQAVNHYHKGNAIVTIVPASDHGMRIAATPQLSRISPGAYNNAVSNIILKWLKSDS